MTKAEGAGQEEGPVQGSWTLPTQAARGGLSQACWSAASDCLQRLWGRGTRKGRLPPWRRLHQPAWGRLVFITCEIQHGQSRASTCIRCLCNTHRCHMSARCSEAPGTCAGPARGPGFLRVHPPGFKSALSSEPLVTW